jgi:hypothetical protein
LLFPARETPDNPGAADGDSPGLHLEKKKPEVDLLPRLRDSGLGRQPDTPAGNYPPGEQFHKNPLEKEFLPGRQNGTFSGFFGIDIRHHPAPPRFEKIVR